MTPSAAPNWCERLRRTAPGRLLRPRTHTCAAPQAEQLEAELPAADQGLAAPLAGDAAAGADARVALARVLRTKDCSGLRKASLIALARHWGYRCDIWQRRPAAVPPPAAGESHKRRRTGAHAAAAPLQPHSVPRLVADPGTLALRPEAVAAEPRAAVVALQSLLQRALSPLAADAAATYAGERALAAARASPQGLRGQGLPDRLRENAKLLQVMAWLVAHVSAQQHLIAGWRAQLTSCAPDGGSAAAWAALRGCEGPTAAVLRTLTETVSAGEADSARIRAQVQAAMPPGTALAPAQLAWWAELDEGATSVLRMLAHADAASAPLRCAPFAAYLDAADAVAAFAARFVADVDAAFRRRRAWMQALHDADVAADAGAPPLLADDMQPWAPQAQMQAQAPALAVPALTLLMSSNADPARAVLASATPGGLPAAAPELKAAPPPPPRPFGAGAEAYSPPGGAAAHAPGWAEDDMFDLLLAGEFCFSVWNT